MAERPKEDCFVSVVAPVCNDVDIVEEFVREVTRVLASRYAYYELVLVDDGSVDDTAARVQELLREIPCVRLVRLSRNFGDEVAMYAGLDAVIGDYIVTMMPRSDPPMLIPEVVARIQQKGGVVVGVTASRSGGLGSRLGAKIFYWVCNHFLGLDVPENSTHFRGLSRRALNALLQIKDKHRYLKVFSTYIGYHHQTLIYTPIRRGNRPDVPRGFVRSLELAVNVMVANSTRLLRLMTATALLASFIDLAYMGYIFLIAVFKTQVAEGWITLSAQNAGMFFFLFVILTVLGEYIGRILAETQDRPLYYVMEENASSVLVTDPEQRNVVVESETHG